MKSLPHAIATPLGLDLAALVDLPVSSQRSPLVVLLHGFAGWKEEEHLSSLAQALANAGIAAVRFDAPGSGESDGTFEHNYRLGTYIDSVATVVSWAIDNLPIEADRIGLWGHSFGGFVALETATRLPIRAVCGSQPSQGAGSYSQQTLDEWKRTGWFTFSSSKFPAIRLPYEFYLERQKYDATRTVRSLNMPLLFIAGTHDDLVPPDVVRTTFEAANEPKEYREFPVDHFYKNDLQVLAEINSLTVKFFVENLSRSRIPE